MELADKSFFEALQKSIKTPFSTYTEIGDLCFSD